MLKRVYSTSKFPASKLHLIPSSGTYPLGFLANGVYSGVKKKEWNDIAVVLSPSHPCEAAAVFTTNKFSAAPVQVSKSILSHKTKLLGVIVNSGCANACTGEQGWLDASEMAQHLDEKPCLVMSTGVIGQHLQMSKIKAGLTKAKESASPSHESWMAAAEGIMTTDTFPKLMSREFKSSSGTYRMAGWSKGAGMSKNEGNN